MKRNKRTGRYIKKESSNRTLYGTLFIVAYIFVVAVTTPSIPIEYISAQEPSEPKVVLIEARINWTEERIKQEIAFVFHEEPNTFIRIAECESELNPKAHNEETDDFGILQINKHYHGDEMESLGLDPLDVKDNLTFGRRLYDESGKSPWSASRHCWKE